MQRCHAESIGRVHAGAVAHERADRIRLAVARRIVQRSPPDRIAVVDEHGRRPAAGGVGAPAMALARRRRKGWRSGGWGRGSS